MIVSVAISTLLWGATGTFAFQRWLNGEPGTDADAVEKVVVNQSTGNVYVLKTLQTATASRVVMVKYTPDLSTELCRYTVTGTASGSHWANLGSALVMDADGNLYLAGTVFNTLSNQDLLVAGVDEHCNQRWKREIDSSGSSDQATAIALMDDAIIVTGFETTDGSQNMYVNKLDIHTGNDRWARPAIIAGTASGTQFNRGTAVIVRSDNNPVVVGSLANADTGQDLAMVVLDSVTGSVISHRYLPSPGSDFATSVVEDTLDGMVIVSGAVRRVSFIAPEILVLKVDPISGSIGWRWNAGGDGSNSIATAIELDPSGNVVITGARDHANVVNFFVAYVNGTTGEQMWLDEVPHNGTAENSYVGGTALAVMSDGILAVGTAERKGTLSAGVAAKFGFDGTPSWLREIRGTAPLSNRAQGVAVRKSDNTTVVVGVVQNKATSLDSVVVHYDNNGKQLKRKEETGTGLIRNRTDAAHASVTDHSGEGSLFIAGSRNNTARLLVGTPTQFTILKTNLTDGALECLYTFDDKRPYLGSVALSVAVDQHGNAVGVGRTGTNASSFTAVGIRPDCSERWRNVFPAKIGDQALSVVIDDQSGQTYVGGKINGRFVVVGLDSATGVEKWRSTLAPGEAKTLARTSAGMIVAGGALQGKPVVVAYDEAGVRLFQKVISGAGEVLSLATTSANEVVAAGVHFSENFDSSMLVAKYMLPTDNTAGRLLWKQAYGGADYGNVAKTVAVDPSSGRIALGGAKIQGGDWRQRFTSILLEPDGTKVWEDDDLYGVVNALGFRADGAVITAGETKEGLQSFFTVRALGSSTGSEEWIRRISRTNYGVTSAATLHVEERGVFSAGTGSHPVRDDDILWLGLNPAGRGL